MSRATDIGYRKPPASTRFQKGRSGNPKGPPKGRHHQPPYDVVLGQMVAIKEDGVERRVTAAEAFLLYMTKRGLEGDGAAARSAMAVIEEARSARHANAGAYPKRIEVNFVTPAAWTLRFCDCAWHRSSTASGQVPESCLSPGWCRKPFPDLVTGGSRLMSRQRSFGRPGPRTKCVGRSGGRSGRSGFQQQPALGLRTAARRRDHRAVARQRSLTDVRFKIHS